MSDLFFGLTMSGVCVLTLLSLLAYKMITE